MDMLRGILATVALIAAFVLVMVLMGRLMTTQDQQQLRAFVEEREAFAPDTFQVLAELGASLRETSGLAVSRRFPGVVWTHNDSGAGPVIHALRLDGTTLRRFRLNAFASDWEAMSSGPCPHLEGVEHCLYIGDVGNNDADRETVQIYVLPEPDPDSDETDDLAVSTIHFAYAEGPDDTEALAVSPSGRLTLVTKGRSGGLRVYHIEPERWVTSLDTEILELEATGTLPFEPLPAIGRMITGGAYSPSGERLAIRSYTEIFFFQVSENGELDSVAEPCFLFRSEPQGEAVAYLDERVLLTTSEAAAGRNSALYRVVCR